MVPESTRAASALGQRKSWNYRNARVAVDRAGCSGGYCAARNPTLADVDHELSWPTASASANRCFTRNADFVQCMRIRHHAFPRVALGAPRTERHRTRRCAHRPETFRCAGDRCRTRRRTEWIAAPALPDRHLLVRRPTVQRATRAEDHTDSSAR